MAYDHTGQRVKYQTGSGITYYPNQYFDVTATTTQDKHIYANNMLLASVHATGTATSTYWVHTDHLGGSSLITDASSTLNELNDYYPFGEVRADQQQTSYQESKKYIGQEYDEDSSLSYLNARYYDGRTGRFQSEDPIFTLLGDSKKTEHLTGAEEYKILADPQSINSYAYGHNNPLKFYDPNGLWALTLGVSGSAFGIDLGLGVYIDKSGIDYYAEQGVAAGAHFLVSGGVTTADLAHTTTVTSSLFATTGDILGGEVSTGLITYPYSSTNNQSKEGTVGFGFGLSGGAKNEISGPLILWKTPKQAEINNQNQATQMVQPQSMNYSGGGSYQSSSINNNSQTLANTLAALQTVLLQLSRLLQSIKK